ncbi:hypothetical protein GCM10023340_36120 [Nocardioides marinquilinus]|uniref:PAS domain S-box-containing protein n=1 Tax=Nocardioides marinquilinus TaxID=1210400 RepID=A0ABP9PX97_9ACTN
MAQVDDDRAAGTPDAARLRRARRLLDRPAVTPALDRLTRLAADLLGVQSAQVSVVTDVTVVTSGVGAASPAGSEDPVESTVCSLVTATEAAVVIEDAARDPRVAAMPPVVAGVVAAYVGVPLVSGGRCVGALCVFGPEPRTWTEDEVETLRRLAGPVVSELELTALEADYEQDRLIWQLAVDAAGVGAFDWNLATNELRWDDRLFELFGLDDETFGGTIEAFAECVVPADRDRVNRALADAIATLGIYQAEYRIALPSGEERWVRARGQAVAGPDGEAARVVGAAYDTTAVHEGEARVSRVLEAIATGYLMLDREWRIAFVNAEAERILGADRADLLGGVVWDLYPATVGSDFERHYRGAVETGRPVTFEAYYPAPLDGWFEIRALPTLDGLAVYFLDVSQRRRDADAARLAAERTELLAEVTSALADTLDPHEAVRRLARLVVPDLGDWSVVSLVDAPTSTGTSWRARLSHAGTWHADPERRAAVERYAQVRATALHDDSYLARVLHDEQVIVVSEDFAEQAGRTLDHGEARDLLAALEPDSALVVQLRGRDRVVGLLSVFRSAERGAFTERDLADASDIAGRAGLALDNARLYAEQRELAEGFQRSVLTAVPHFAGLDVEARWAPAAEAARVGGDWYDAFGVDDDVVVVIGDVVGHDTAAAAAMSQVRSMLRGIAVTTDHGPADLLCHVDSAIDRLRLETSATAVAARLTARPGGARLRWASAGHPPPLLVEPTTAGGSVVRRLDDGDPDLLLGVDSATRRREHDVDLAPGSVLLLYTDGLVERRGGSIDDGIDALAALLGDLVDAGTDPAALCDRVLAHVAPDELDDDIACIAVRVRG